MKRLAGAADQAVFEIPPGRFPADKVKEPSCGFFAVIDMDKGEEWSAEAILRPAAEDGLRGAVDKEKIALAVHLGDEILGAFHQFPVPFVAGLEFRDFVIDDPVAQLHLVPQQIFRLFDAQHRPDLGNQFHAFDGFGQKGVRPGFQAPGAALGIGMHRGCHDDRDMAGAGIGLQGTAHLVAVHARHFDIQQDRVRLLFLRLPESLGPGQGGQQQAVRHEIGEHGGKYGKIVLFIIDG